MTAHARVRYRTFGIMKALISTLLAFLRSERTVRILFLINMAVALGMAWMTRDIVLGDTSSYLGLAEGILHGNYSMWWELGPDYPDTFRAPGFPLFIAIIIKTFGSWRAVVAVNYLLYGVGLYLTVKTVKLIDPRPEARNVMLLLLISLLNVPYYISQAYPEIPALAGLCAILFILVRQEKMKILHGVLLGLLYGFVFQCKPIFLLFPFILPLVGWAALRIRFKPIGHLVALGIFMLTLLPYGLWNKDHHGVFSVTPIEGGAGVLHFGYWAGRIPGYTENVYWNNFTGDELVRFVSKDSIQRNIEIYENEWDHVNEQLTPLLTMKDSIMLVSASKVEHRPVKTFNSAYTLERERLLKKLTIQDVTRTPGYYSAYKVYSAVRLWVIGIQRADFVKASITGKIALLYGPVTTGCIFLMFILVVPVSYYRHRLSWARTWPILLLVIYFGIVHIPFVIQARYTTPVRPAMLLLLALAIVSLSGRSRREGGGEQAPSAMIK